MYSWGSWLYNNREIVSTLIFSVVEPNQNKTKQSETTTHIIFFIGFHSFLLACLVFSSVNQNHPHTTSLTLPSLSSTKRWVFLAKVKDWLPKSWIDLVKLPKLLKDIMIINVLLGINLSEPIYWIYPVKWSLGIRGVCAVSS